MVSPSPSISNAPIPIADFMRPSSPSPACIDKKASQIAVQLCIDQSSTNPHSTTDLALHQLSWSEALTGLLNQCALTDGSLHAVMLTVNSVQKGKEPSAFARASCSALVTRAHDKAHCDVATGYLLH